MDEVYDPTALVMALYKDAGERLYEIVVGQLERVPDNRYRQEANRAGIVLDAAYADFKRATDAIGQQIRYGLLAQAASRVTIQTLMSHEQPLGNEENFAFLSGLAQASAWLPVALVMGLTVHGPQDFLAMVAAMAGVTVTVEEEAA